MPANECDKLLETPKECIEKHLHRDTGIKGTQVHNRLEAQPAFLKTLSIRTASVRRKQ